MNPELRCTVSGTGPRLVLLHGVTRCGADWAPILPGLEPDWEVVSLDQRGHGWSPRADRYLVTDYVQDAVRWLQAESCGPVVLLGHSLGAMVAAGVAAAVPELVHGIILEDPPFHTMGERIGGTAWQAQFAGMREVAQKGVLGVTPGEMADALAEIRLPAPDGGFRRLGDVRDRASLEWSAECLTRLDPEVLSPVIEGRWLEGYDLERVCAGIRCPVLLLQADPGAGGALTDQDAEVFTGSVCGCRRVRFSGCGHQLHRERAVELVREVAFSGMRGGWGRVDQV